MAEYEGNMGKGALWSLPILGGSPRRLGDLIGQSAAWSPDGRMLAYGNDNELFRAKADGSESRKITTAKNPVYFPVWSPDGTHLQFTAPQVDFPRGSLWEVSADGTDLHRFPPGWSSPPGECCGRWTADGKYFVFVSNNQIWAVPQESGFFTCAGSPCN